MGQKTKDMDLNNKIVIYQTADGQTAIDVRMDGDTVWLSQAQMAELFQTDRTSILRHIKNIYKTGELEEKPTCAFFAQVRTEGKRAVTRQIPYYNLDMIISVGYRVKSQRGTQFRIWANKVLKDYLVKGYAINKALTEQHYMELKQLVNVLGRTVKTQEALTSDDALNLVEVVSNYAYALDTLDKYDYQQLAVEKTTNEEKFHATYEGALQAIGELKEKFGGSQWFANEKDDSFKSSIGQKTYCCHALLMVYGRQRHLIQPEWHKTHCRQHSCRLDANDSRKPDGRKRCDGESGGELD